MNILFIHQNFPGQFKHLAPALAGRGHNVVAMVMRNSSQKLWRGVKLVSYGSKRSTSKAMHPWLTDFETKVIRAEACFYAATAMKKHGFEPDLIVAHPGWGESLFLKEVWPNARMGIYCEFFYHSEGADVNFDPEFISTDPGQRCRLNLKNLNNLVQFEVADAGISPTQWQASTFPQRFRQNITVVHDGIDTNLVRPDPEALLEREDLTGTPLTLSRRDEIITFVNRNLEPYRGYHRFMRALPHLLKSRPQAKVLIVGGEGTSYGKKPPEGQTWKQIYLDEISPQLSDAELSRIHFLGHLDYQAFVKLLQVSRVHVYLTYPFVLGWSLLEAMACGCAIVASDTAPLKEVIVDRETGLLVDFFDHQALADKIINLLNDEEQRHHLGENARKLATARYDLNSVSLPRQLAWVESKFNMS